MKRYGQLWASVPCWPNLLLAAKKARRGKSRRPVVRRFHFRSEWELLALSDALHAGTYRPGPFTVHVVSRPKRRMISAAPYRDRVVNHALMNVLEPIFDRHFHPHSFACRRGKGTHAAADRLQALLRRYRYHVASDVRQFFPSIDHRILKSLVRRRIKDARVLALIDLLVDSSNDQESPIEYFPGDDLFAPAVRRRGLPIGNLTSQWFANLYLDGLDHFVTSHLGIGGYVRYCDDFVLLGNEPAVLRSALDRVVEYAAGLRLKLHTERSAVRRNGLGVRFVGFRIWPTHRYLLKKNLRAFRRRLRWMKKAHLSGRISLDEVNRRVSSWLGHALQADSDGVLRRLIPEMAWFQDHPAMKKE